MRKLLLLGAALVLAACGQPAQPGGAGQQQASAPPVFPTLNTGNYKLEATITSPETGEQMNVVQYRSGANMRMEMQSMTLLVNSQTNEAVNLITQGGRTMAMRVPLGNVDTGMQLLSGDTAAMQLVGPCTGAGEVGFEWAKTDEDGRSTGCLTPDGILLRGAVDGKTSFEATRVTRGVQDPALFTIPAGVQVMDLGGLAAKIGKAQ